MFCVFPINQVDALNRAFPGVAEDACVMAGNSLGFQRQFSSHRQSLPDLSAPKLILEGCKNTIYFFSLHPKLLAPNSNDYGAKWVKGRVKGRGEGEEDMVESLSLKTH